MRAITRLFAGPALVLCFAFGVTFAGSDVNEVGAMLVYPTVAAVQGVVCADGAADGAAFCSPAGSVETFITLTNAGPQAVVAHASYINGDDGPQSAGYCDECNFAIALSGYDTETLVVANGPAGIRITSEDGPLDLSCPFPFGMLVVVLEDAWGSNLTDNVLLGEQVVVDYSSGAAFSIPAIPFQGGSAGGDDWRNYGFDDLEYGKLPRMVAADFLAPRLAPALASPGVLSLFTLGFDRGHPPLVDCSVTGFDAREQAFSANFQFGCRGIADLCDISPEFCHPNLGLVGHADSHGWLQLDCRVDQDPALANGFDVDGGVHGAIIQLRSTGQTLPAGSGATLGSAVAWARALHQSVTTGDAVTLHLEIDF